MTIRPPILVFLLFLSLHGLAQFPFVHTYEGELHSYGSNTPDIIRAASIRKEMIYADSTLIDSIIYNSRGQVAQYTYNPLDPKNRTTSNYFYDSLGRTYKIFEDHEYPK